MECKEIEIIDGIVHFSEKMFDIFEWNSEDNVWKKLIIPSIPYVDIWKQSYWDNEVDKWINPDPFYKIVNKKG